MRRKSKYSRGFSVGQKLIMVGCLCAFLAVAVLVSCSLLGGECVQETDELTIGIDVAKYQGTIDWQQVAASGIDYAMIRVGYRSQVDGTIEADTNARYNMQEASKYGIRIGVYFFSTAVSEEEAKEEALWVADYISQYPITYPVAYDCEGFLEAESRQYHMTKEERTDAALAFLKTIEKKGYEPMFYASKNELQNGAQWEVHRIQDDYKIWVAQYPVEHYPQTPASSYEGVHQMWQYATDGRVNGISQNVDLNVCYFGYDGVKEPKNDTVPDEAFPDPEALMDFMSVYEVVTAKDETNLRSIPSQDTDSQVLYTLQNGETAFRTGISDSGWSRVEFNGNRYYAVSSYLTTDMNYDPSSNSREDEDGIQTQFQEVNEEMTAKEKTNLRNIPSVTSEDSQIIATIFPGDIVIRTGINEDVGWSRVEYNGQVLYCVSSLLTTPQ